MTTTTLNRHDHLIQNDVEDELAWAPQVKDAQIGVSVLDGVVTLSGEVDTYLEKVEAKNAALRVNGVTVVADDLKLSGAVRLEHTDTDTAVAIKHVLEWATNIPHDDIDVEVRDRFVVLSGTVHWNYQREGAERLVRGVDGVRRIDNRIQLTPRVSASDASQLITAAFVRHALLEAAAVTVTTVGSEVTLTGHVGTWAEKDAAAQVAWSSPSASVVHNRLVVRP